jgi:hypothetical protein
MRPVAPGRAVRGCGTRHLVHPIWSPSSSRWMTQCVAAATQPLPARRGVHRRCDRRGGRRPGEPPPRRQHSKDDVSSGGGVLWSILLAAPIRSFALGAVGDRLSGMRPASHPSDNQLDTATWCRHLIPERSVYAFLADHRQQLFPPELFADVARRGGEHPSMPAEVIGSVMALQALEGLSDREAISALRRDIAWKVACGCGWTTRGSTTPCWCTGELVCGPQIGRGGSLTRSARSSRQLGCSRGGVGGCWTP